MDPQNPVPVPQARGSNRTTNSILPKLAIVAIGRNEGERLNRCLESVCQNALTVYVDSGSTDSSRELAIQQGIILVDLDMSTPFTAARARNAGIREVMRRAPDTTLIQFVDGDCEIVPNWLQRAQNFIVDNPRVAAACGRRRERFPNKSIYNKLCDIEWRVTPGQTKYFGGDVMIRTAALQEVGGYRDDLIAGEEPELSLRIRSKGWFIHVLPYDMTLHDADMTGFRQWWRRMKRSGYAYAAGAHLHGASPERHWVWETIQAWIWVPGPIILTLSLASIFGSWALTTLLAYPLQVVRLYVKSGGPRHERMLMSVAYTLCRFPEFAGQLKYLADTLARRAGRLVEYK